MAKLLGRSNGKPQAAPLIVSRECVILAIGSMRWNSIAS
jgi:hypothetical protein